MDLNKDGLIVTAERYGTVLFSGASRVNINADAVTFSGFQYVGGSIGTLNVINVFGSDVVITQVNIQNYTSHKYLVVDEDSKRTTISYCNFENRLNLDDKNILSILVGDEPGYHKIQYCSFKNFDGIGKDQGIEPIRIGVSSQGELDSRTLVEYCYFKMCNGDGEIISHKSRQNVYRYNTFENNPVAELVLRHGDEGIIYGNFFLNNMGGVRVREGSDHFIYNNYFEGIDRRAIWLVNDPSDPLSDIHIYHNTIIDSEEFNLGGTGSNPPFNVTLANNIFTNPQDVLFVAKTGNETWLSNFSSGDIGIDLPATGLVDTDPVLYENTEGFFQPEANSPVIAAASEGYPAVPLYEGMDYDNELLYDVMKEERPATISDRAIGASDYSSTVKVQPHATEMNTGSSNIDWTVVSSMDWISTDLSSGSGDTQLKITVETNDQNDSRSGTITIAGGSQTVTVDVYQDAGQMVGVSENLEKGLLLFPNPTDGKIKLSNLPSSIYSTQLELIDIDGRRVFSEVYRIESNELVIDLEKVLSGTYLLNVKFMSRSGTVYADLSRKIVRT